MAALLFLREDLIGKAHGCLTVGANIVRQRLHVFMLLNLLGEELYFALKRYILHLNKSTMLRSQEDKNLKSNTTTTQLHLTLND